jgi:hypothetical protein
MLRVNRGSRGNGDDPVAQDIAGLSQQQRAVDPAGKRHRETVEGFQNLQQTCALILKQGLYHRSLLSR